MIDKNTCKLLGILAKTHGTDGSLVLRLDSLETDEVTDPDFVFIEMEGLWVPFFVENLKERTSCEFLVKFSDINSTNQANELTGYKVFVSNKNISEGRSLSHQPEIKDFQVIDRKLGFIGTAVEILDLAQNPLLKVINDKEEEHLIPYHPDLIQEIDTTNKRIVIEAPDGLFQL